MARAFDLLGNIAIVNFSRGTSLVQKKKVAKEILESNKSVKTVLEKSGKVKGRLRKPETKYLVGDKTKEVLYRENGCTFRFNVDTTYFSPRLSNERLEITNLVKKGESVFIGFAGVAPFSVIIAKNSKASRVVSNELNKIANKYGRLNAELNKVKDKIEFWDGDLKKVVQKHRGEKFDVIVMPRPQLKDPFIVESLVLAKKGTRVYYYDFCRNDSREEIIEKVKRECARAKRKIKILDVKKAGEIAPYKIRIRVDFKVL